MEFAIIILVIMTPKVVTLGSDSTQYYVDTSYNINITLPKNVNYEAGTAC